MIEIYVEKDDLTYQIQMLSPRYIFVSCMNRVYMTERRWCIEERRFLINRESARMAERKVKPFIPTMEYLTDLGRVYRTAKLLDPDGDFYSLFRRTYGKLLVGYNRVCIPEFKKGLVLDAVKGVMEKDNDNK